MRQITFGMDRNHSVTRGRPWPGGHSAPRRRPDNLGDRWDGSTYRRTQNRWHPYGDLIYFHLLLKGLDEAGVLASPPAGRK